MTEVQEARRGRKGDRRERRRKEGDAEVLGLKLPIPQWVYDKYPKTEFRHRWFRAESGRMFAKTKADDWDPVEGIEPVPGAHDQHGTPVEHVLCVKYLDWWKADRAKMEARRIEVEEQIRRGDVTGKGDDAGGEALSSDVSYASESNRLR